MEGGEKRSVCVTVACDGRAGSFREISSMADQKAISKVRIVHNRVSEIGHKITPQLSLIVYQTLYSRDRILQSSHKNALRM